jgi:type I restriction enzyme, S subunit
MTHENGWPMVPLGEVAAPVQRAITVVPGKSYRTLGVKWWGEGAYERQTIDGSRTAARILYEVQQDDLIINKIWVRHGSVGIVGPEVSGCVGSNEFPTFELLPDLILPRWLHWYSKTQELWQKCDALSQGTSGKNRIRPERFLTIEIPLPQLSVQRRVVAKIEQLASKFEEVQRLHKKSIDERRFLWPAFLGRFFRSLAENNHVLPLGQLSIKITDGPHKTPVYVDTGVPFVTVQNMVTGKLNFNGLRYITAEDHAQISTRCKPELGDVLYSKDGATRGEPCFVDTEREFNIFVSVALIKTRRDQLDGEYLCHLLRSQWIRERMVDRSRGDMIPHIVLRACFEIA